MDQLEIYASIFFLEYDIDPRDIETELRIYQNDQIEIANPLSDDVLPIMDKMILFDEIIEKLKKEIN